MPECSVGGGASLCPRRCPGGDRGRLRSRESRPQVRDPRASPAPPGREGEAGKGGEEKAARTNGEGRSAGAWARSNWARSAALVEAAASPGPAGAQTRGGCWGGGLSQGGKGGRKGEKEPRRRRRPPALQSTPQTLLASLSLHPSSLPPPPPHCLFLHLSIPLCVHQCLSIPASLHPCLHPSGSTCLSLHPPLFLHPCIPASRAISPQGPPGPAPSCFNAPLSEPLLAPFPSHL